MNRRLTIMLSLVIACVAIGAAVRPSSASAGKQSSCEVTAFPPEFVYGYFIAGLGQIECSGTTSGMVLTVCLQRYQTSTGSWIEVSDSCVRQPLWGTYTGVYLSRSAQTLCNSYPIGIDWRTHAHGIWSPGGQGDDFSPSSSSMCN